MGRKSKLKGGRPLEPKGHVPLAFTDLNDWRKRRRDLGLEDFYISRGWSEGFDTYEQAEEVRKEMKSPHSQTITIGPPWRYYIILKSGEKAPTLDKNRGWDQFDTKGWGPVETEMEEA